MTSPINRQALLAAFADYLSQFSYNPHGFSETVRYTVTDDHPDRAVDFSAKQGVVVLKTLPYIPAALGVTAEIELQATTWTATQADCGYLADTLAHIIKCVTPAKVPMRGQIIQPSVVLGTLQPPTFSQQNNLWYAPVPFSVWVTTSCASCA
jgi:hypothetical protein